MIVTYLVFAGIFLYLLKQFLDSKSFFKKQLIPLSIAFAICVAAYLVDELWLKERFPFQAIPIIFPYLVLFIIHFIFTNNSYSLTTVSYSEIVRNVSDLILVLSPDMRVLEINPAAQKILNCPDHWALGRPLVQVSYPLYKLLTVQEETSEDFHKELQLGGEISHRYYSISVKKMSIGLEEKDGQLLVLRDITGFKEIDKALEASVLRYQTLFNQAYDVIIIANMNQKIVDVNPAATRLLGFSRNEFLKMTLEDVYVPEGYIDSKNLAYTNMEPLFETELRHKTGFVVPVEVTISPLVIPGEPLYLLFFRDITERKKAQLTMKRAKETAEEASRAKSAFLANMSHEIRTPLNAVIGMSSLLLNTKMPLQQQEYVETIRSSSETLLSIINDILDLSKIEAGKIELDHTPFVLRECIEDVFDLAASRANAKGIDVSYFIEENTPEILTGDASRLRQILLNIISNGIKFTPKGEVSLRVKTFSLDTEKIRLQFSIRDTGIGIPKERLSRLFKTFSQVDSSTTRKYGGSGLGLVISKQLCEIMGGHIEVSSQEGHGSTFTFSVIMDRADDFPLPPFLQEPPKEIKGKRILAVVGTEALRLTLEGFNRLWKINMDCTTDIKHAVSLYEEKPADLVFLDNEKISRQGTGLLEMLRKEKKHRQIKVFLLDFFPNTPLPILFDDSIRKPLRITNLHYMFLRMEDKISQEDYSKESQLENTLQKEFATKYPLHILLAEDNAVNQKVALLILDKLGYKADVANNGVEALEAIKLKKYDVILMDDHMPIMDGVEATNQIRKSLPPGLQPFIIAITANAMPESRDKYLKAGMNEYIKKPVEIPTLKNILKQAAKSPQGELWENLPQPVQTSKGPATMIRWEEEFPAERNHIIKLFKKESDKIIEKLTIAIEKKDFPEIQFLSHSLKSSCRILGAERLANLASNLEKKGQTEENQTLEETLLLLKKQYQRFIEKNP